MTAVLEQAGAVAPADADRFRRIWRGFGSTVALISTADEGQPHAMLATAVTSVSMEPPSLLICVNRSASSYPALVARGAFALGLIPASGETLARSIATAASADRLRHGTWDWHRPDDTGPALPWLVEAQATLFCRVAVTLDHGTHRLFVAEVLSAAGGDTIDPLIHCDGRYGGFRA